MKTREEAEAIVLEGMGKYMSIFNKLLYLHKEGQKIEGGEKVSAEAGAAILEDLAKKIVNKIYS